MGIYMSFFELEFDHRLGILESLLFRGFCLVWLLAK